MTDTKFINPQPIISAAQVLTASFVDLGVEIDMREFQKLGLFLNIDINSSTDLQVKAIGLTKSGGTIEYLLPITSVSFTNAKVSYKTVVFEFENDADQAIILEVETGNIIPFVRLQVKVGTVGGTAGEILNALVSKAG